MLIQLDGRDDGNHTRGWKGGRKKCLRSEDWYEAAEIHRTMRFLSMRWKSEEMEHAMEVMALKDMGAEVLDIFAFTAQPMGKGASEYAKKRQAVREGKVNRGYEPALGHNKTSIDLDGKVTLNAGQLQDTLTMIKARAQCHDCGQKGHWRGDRACPKAGSKPSSRKGGEKGCKKGRKGGFLHRAGMAERVVFFIEQGWQRLCWHGNGKPCSRTLAVLGVVCDGGDRVAVRARVYGHPRSGASALQPDLHGQRRT